MRDKILNVEFKLLESVGCRFSLYVEFKHLPESPENEVLTSFEFTHCDGSLSVVFLLNDVKH